MRPTTLMTLIPLILLLSWPLRAQTTSVQITLTFQNETIPVLKWMIERNFMDAADTNEDGTLSDAEALAWFEDQAQDVVTSFQVRAVTEAESNPDGFALLPAASQTIKNDRDGAVGDWEAEKRRLTGQ